MSRQRLLAALSSAALIGLSGHVAAQNITGGGGSNLQYDYYAEFSTFNAGQAAGAATFNNGAAAQTPQESLFWAVNSLIAQESFIYDDVVCDQQRVLAGNKNCPSGTGDTYGSAETIYGITDATLSSTLIGFWATSSYGQAQAGNLIQLPAMGLGIALPVRNASVTTNTNITLTEGDICGIFSGLITDWSGVSGYNAKSGQIAPGAITVLYRSDSVGTTFLLWNHLKAVCTTRNSAFNMTLLGSGPGQSFASLFPGGTLPVTPGGFVGVSPVTGMASALLAHPSAIGYITPDFTNVAPGSGAIAAYPADIALIPAYIQNSANGKRYLPSAPNLTLALNSIASSTPYTGGNYPVAGDSPINAYAVPPASTAPWNPNNWVPLTGYVTNGYPIVGYAEFDLAQCYANAAVAAGVVAFLTDHYGLNSANAATYAGIITGNGYVQIASSGAKSYVNAIKTQILKAKNPHAIGFAPACKLVPGR